MVIYSFGQVEWEKCGRKTLTTEQQALGQSLGETTSVPVGPAHRGPCFWQVSSVNYYFDREVKHLEYVQQRKLIRDQEKKEMALELVKKKTVSEMSERRAAFSSSPWESVAGLIPPESCARHSFLLCLMRTKRTFLWFP